MLKRKKHEFITVFLIILWVLSLTKGVADSTSEKFGIIQVKGGEYIVQNNVWGASTSQTITVPDTNECSFTVSHSNHNQEGVASYPSIFKGSHWGLKTAGWESIKINELPNCYFNWTVNVNRPSGKYNIAAESWFSSTLDTSQGYSGGAELMIWLDTLGMVPAGSKVGIFGSYEVWYVQMDWNYICYFQTGVNSVNINLSEFIEDSVIRGYLNSTWYLHDLEAGFEICSGGEGLTVESFSFTVSEKKNDKATTLASTSTISTTAKKTPIPLISIVCALILMMIISFYRERPSN